MAVFQNMPPVIEGQLGARGKRAGSLLCCIGQPTHVKLPVIAIIVVRHYEHALLLRFLDLALLHELVFAR
jgi:hypothetical protein